VVTRLDPPYRSHDQVSGCLIVPTCITCTACIENEIWCQEMSRGTSTAKKILLDRANCHRRYILYIIHILFYIKKQGTKSEPHVINIYRQINSTSSSSFSLLNTILIPLLFSISSLTFCCCGLVVHALPCYPSCSCRTAGCSFLDASVPSHAPSGDGYSSQFGGHGHQHTILLLCCCHPTVLTICILSLFILLDPEMINSYHLNKKEHTKYIWLNVATSTDQLRSPFSQTVYSNIFTRAILFFQCCYFPYFVGRVPAF
jgi:hypothetical protein